MENMEVLVRGLVMQNAGLGLGTLGLQGLQVQVLWLVAVATIVLAVVSVTRVSYVSVGWTWGAKPGQLRVRVQSFSSLLGGGIVTAGGVFSAEIVNCSADSCSEDASSSAVEAEAAEMLFFFENKSASSPLLTQASAPALAVSEKVVRKRSKSLDFPKTESLQRSKSFDLQRIESLLLSSPQPFVRAVVLREGIVWNASHGSLAACGVDGLLPVRAHSLATSAPRVRSRAVTRNSCADWDPLLKLRIRDAVVRDGASSLSVKEFTFPSAPVEVQGSGIAALGDDVVRVWDSETRSLVKSMRLPKGGDAPVTAFDVKWGLEAVVTATKGGLVSLADVESAGLSNLYETEQPIVQAVHLDRSPVSKTMFTGGPSAVNPGCCIALWDSRSSRREVTLGLTSASAVYGIHSQGEELYVKDEASSLAAHDMRMLGASTLTRVPCEKKLPGAPEDRWWDMDAALEEEDDVDDDDFMECQAVEETKRTMTSMSCLVTVVSRSFSSKALST